MFPKYPEIQDPLLVELKRRGGVASPSDTDADGQTVYDALADHFELSSEARGFKIFEKNGSERSKWKNMVRWARNELRKDGYLVSPKRGIWALTEEGLQRSEELVSTHEASTTTFSGKYSISLEAFKKRQQQADEIGHEGEMIVLNYELEKLKSIGRNDLAKQVEHTSQVNVAAGYDIKSFDIDGNPLFIEVKTTRGQSLSFELTSNELKTAKKLRSSYWIYRVINLNKVKQDIIQISDPWRLIQEGQLITKPTSYRVTPSEHFEK